MSKVTWYDFPVNRDNRGTFTEVYRMSQVPLIVRQLNLSRSKMGVMRGLHYHEVQTDYWMIVSGLAQVVVGEGGRGTWGRREYESRVLAPGQAVLIPPLHPHGFLALTDVLLMYGVDTEYSHDQPDEYTMSARFFQDWMRPIETMVMSHRDAQEISWPTPEPY